jgi:hypothetical protein
MKSLCLNVSGLATGRDLLWYRPSGPHCSPELVAGRLCPGCGTGRAIDLRTVDRHPLALVGTLLLGLPCSWCPGVAPMHPEVLTREVVNHPI